MEEHNQVFDICIICAMYEEAEAVLKQDVGPQAKMRK